MRVNETYFSFALLLNLQIATFTSFVVAFFLFVVFLLLTCLLKDLHIFLSHWFDCIELTRATKQLKNHSKSFD